MFILPLAGCGYISAVTDGDTMPRYETSSGSDTAVTAEVALRPFEPACRILQDEEAYRELIIDAGAVELHVECSRATGLFGERIENLGRASLAFEAEPGERYRIEFSDDFGFPHVAVTLAEDESLVVHRGLLDSRSVAAPGAAHVTLVSRSGPGVIPCKFGRPWAERRTSSVRRASGSFEHEPYSHQIVAECSTYAYLTGDVKERYEAPIDFVPESGRLYTVHMDEEDPNYVFVTDVSGDVRTVAHVKAIRTL